MKKEGYDYGNMSGMMCGNSIDIKIPTRDVAEIRADVVMESSYQEDYCDVVRVWGQVLDKSGCPIPYALLKLVKVIDMPEGKKYQGMAHGISDSNGFYQFDVYYCEGNEYYKIIVSRMYTGCEEVQTPTCRKHDCKRKKPAPEGPCPGEEADHGCNCKPCMKAPLGNNCEYTMDRPYS